jgi:hypothetical protein
LKLRFLAAGTVTLTADVYALVTLSAFSLFSEILSTDSCGEIHGLFAPAL